MIYSGHPSTQHAQGNTIYCIIVTLLFVLVARNTAHYTAAYLKISYNNDCTLFYDMHVQKQNTYALHSENT